MKEQCSKELLLIEPLNFSCNKETLIDNVFQNLLISGVENIKNRALKEFRNLIYILQKNNITCITFQDQKELITPDSVFPNNWISFHEDKMVIYPMYAKNRRLERRSDIINYFNHHKIIDYTDYENRNIFLEGTGSMVLDRINNLVYASISTRTHYELLEQFCEDLNYKPISFRSYSNLRNKIRLIYHTNVMMSICEEYVIICTESIKDIMEQKLIIKSFRNREIIEISEKQMNLFAGNVLQVKNIFGEKILLMSETAYRAFNKEQINIIEKYNIIQYCSIPTIEYYGGGSVRCMIAEIF